MRTYKCKYFIDFVLSKKDSSSATYESINLIDWHWFHTFSFLRNRWNSYFASSVENYLGPHQTSNFCKQYCDKKTKRHCNNEIKRHFSGNIFFSPCELKISIHGYFSWFWKALAIFCQKILLLSQKLSLYRNIACQNRSSVEGLREWKPRKLKSR